MSDALLTTADLALGTIGIEGGVSDFTPIGTPVVLAARFEELARGGRRILVDRMTFNAVRDLVEAECPPQQLELKRPGQTLGKTFEQYHLKALKSDSPTGEGAVAAAAASPASACTNT